MKKYLIYLFAIAFSAGMVACVDDYQDANPAPQLDAPAGSMSPSTGTPTNSKGQIVLAGGEEATLSISIVDAPGKLDSIAYEFSRGGEVVSSTFESVVGQETGTFTVTFRAPYNLNGVTSLSVIVFDSQLDEDGENDPKSINFSQSFDVSFAYAAPTVELDIPEAPIFMGGSKNIVARVTAAPGGGIDTLLASTVNGNLEVNMADVQALLGQESGDVRMTYTAPEDQVGEFPITIFAVDRLQNRSTTVRETIEVVYEFDAPEFMLDFSGADTLAGATPTTVAGDTIAFVIDLISVPSGIQDISISVEEGDVEFDFEDLVDATSGKVEAVYDAPNEDGFFTIEVTVTNNEGQTSTESQRIAVYTP